jgi:hypothetical protein
MSTLTVQKVGGIGALGVAAGLCCAALLVLLAPAAAFYSSEPSWLFVGADYLLALVGLAGLAAAPAITERVAAWQPGWMRWTGTLAQLGFGVLAVVSFWQAEYELALTGVSFDLPVLGYEEEAVGGTRWQELVARQPKGWLEVAGVGLWMLSVSWLARRKAVFPEDLNSVGRAAGLTAFCTVLGATLQVEPLLMLGIMGGLVLQPMWFGWMGWILVHEVRAEGPAGPVRAVRKRRRPLWSLRRRGLVVLARYRRDRKAERAPERTEPPAEQLLLN